MNAVKYQNLNYANILHFFFLIRIFGGFKNGTGNHRYMHFLPDSELRCNYIKLK